MQVGCYCGGAVGRKGTRPVYFAHLSLRAFTFGEVTIPLVLLWGEPVRTSRCLNEPHQRIRQWKIAPQEILEKKKK